MLTYEEFYGAALTELKQTQSQLLGIVQEYSEAAYQSGQIKPAVYCCSRLKSPESVLQKCSIRGFAPDVSAALDNLFDPVGIRVVCAFSADVYRPAGWLKGQAGIEIVQEKDYYSYPKPNGYRGYLPPLICPCRPSGRLFRNRFLRVRASKRPDCAK